MKRVKIYSIICMIAAIILVAVSCVKEEKDEAPSVPDYSTLNMDFSSFTDLSKKSANPADTTRIYFGKAALTVGFWSLVAGAVTTIPAVAFKAVIENSKPTFDDENKVWVWKVLFKIASDDYEAKLTGKLSEDSVHWDMEITSKIGTLEVSKDKWFEGTSHYARTGGWWILYNTTKDLASLKLDWKRESDKVGYLKYTMIEQGNVNKGGFIEFGSVASGNFDKYFKAKATNPAVDTRLCLIEWSSTTKEGHIYIGEGESMLKYCWGPTLADLPTCP